MTEEERKTQVERAIANERLEGLEVSPETRELLDGYIVGEMTADEVAKKVYQRYGIRQ